MSGGVLSVATTPAIDRISLARGGVAAGIVRASEALETPGGKEGHAADVERLKKLRESQPGTEYPRGVYGSCSVQEP